MKNEIQVQSTQGLADWPSDEQIVQELMALQQRSPALGLLQFESLIRANQYRRLYRLVRNYLVPGQSVLDWGCGNGHFSYFLTRSGYQASGFALHSLALRETLEPGGFQFAQGPSDEVAKLPYDACQFDGVVSVGVLEHVREVGGQEIASLREIWRILKPGGLFLCYHLPNTYSLIEWMASYLPRMHHHAYRYTQKDIAQLCQQADFDLMAVERYGALPRNIWSRLPGFGNSSWLANGIEPLDRGLGLIFSGICQNYYFVAQKPPDD